MCGISGIISINNLKLTDHDLTDLDTLLDSMVHRGPDAVSYTHLRAHETG
jgi:asparagine synthetase B (glutamine-hydrolysing)